MELPTCPLLAVDVVVVDKEKQQIVMIKRRFPPLGLALPGGFVDIGESVESAAVREIKEEIGVYLNQGDLKLIGVFSEPNRDPRKHVVSVVFYAETTQMAVAGDDAKEIVMTDFNDVMNENVVTCFDHKEIIVKAYHMLNLGK